MLRTRAFYSLQPMAFRSIRWRHFHHVRGSELTNLAQEEFQLQGTTMTCSMSRIIPIIVYPSWPNPSTIWRHRPHVLNPTATVANHDIERWYSSSRVSRIIAKSRKSLSHRRKKLCIETAYMESILVLKTHCPLYSSLPMILCLTGSKSYTTERAM